MKTSILLFGSFIIFSAAHGQIVPGGPRPSPPPGLASWWMFDELQSAVCFDYADDFAADLTWDGARTSGIVHRDLAARNVLLAATGDGDGDGQNEFLRCSKQGWDGTIKGGPFTVAFWMTGNRTQTLMPPASIVDARAVTEVGPTRVVRGFAVRFHGPQIGAFFGRGTSGANVSLMRTLPPALPGRLTHIACVCPPASTGGVSRIYADGVELPGVTAVPAWEWPVNPELLVGSAATGSMGVPFRGELDDLMIFARALDALEIAALAQAGAGGLGPPAPGYFETDSLQVGVDDLLANAPEPAEPGPALRARFPGVQWVGCDERPGEFAPGHFGHRVRVAAGDVNGDGFMQGAKLIFRWQPKCPMCDIPVIAKLFLDCVNAGEVVGPATPWDYEHLLTDLGGTSTADGSVLVELDLSKLPGGSNILPAVQRAAFFDIFIDDALADFARLEVQRQTRALRAFGHRQELTDNAALRVEKSHAVISPRDAASGLPTGKRIHKPLGRNFVDQLFQIPNFPVGGRFDFRATAVDWTIDTQPPVSRASLALTRNDDTIARYTILLEADLDGDGQFEPVVERLIQVWNTGTLVWAGRATEQTSFTAAATGDKLCTVSDGRNIFLTIKPTLVQILDAPEGPLPPLLATEVRVFDSKSFPPGGQDGPDNQRLVVDTSISGGIPALLVHAESTGVSSPRDAASGLPTGKRQHRPIKFYKEWSASSPNAGLRTTTGGIMHEDSWNGFVATRRHAAQALDVTAPRAIPPPATTAFLPIDFGDRIESFDLAFEVPSIRVKTKEDVYVWKIRTRGLFNGQEGPLDESELISIDEPGVHFADGSVRLARVDFSALGATGYRVEVRGWDPVKKETILLKTLDSATLPDILFDDLPTVCGKLGRATPCRKWCWPGNRGLRVNGEAFDAHEIRVLATGVKGQINHLLASENEFSGFRTLAVVGAAIEILPLCEVCPFQVVTEGDDVIVTFDPLLGYLQDAPVLNGPWAETPDVNNGRLVWPRGNRLRHFFRVVDPGVPRVPAP